MTFDISTSRMFRAALLRRHLPFGLLKFIERLCFIGGGLAALIGLFSWMYIHTSLPTPLPVLHLLGSLDPNRYASIPLVLIPIGFSLSFFLLFIDWEYSRPRLNLFNYQNPTFNLADAMTLPSAEILLHTMHASSHAPTNERVVHLAFLHAFFEEGVMQEYFIRAGVNPNRSKKNLPKAKKNLPTDPATFSSSPCIQTILSTAFHYAVLVGAGELSPAFLFAAFVDHAPEIKSEFAKLNMDIPDLRHLAEWFHRKHVTRDRHREFWRLDRLLRRPPVGKNWIYGFTPTLSRFAKETSEQALLHRTHRIIGRQEEIERIEQTLAASGRNNILLVGDAGVGKETIIHGVTDRIAHGLTLPVLNFKRVFDLNISLFLSNFESKERMQTAFTRLLNEAEYAGNIILVLHNLHTIAGTTSEGLGKIDTQELLIPFLASDRLQVIATTTIAEFHARLENSSLLTLFTRIDVTEPSLEVTRAIVEDATTRFEKKFGTLFTYRALEMIVQDADRYIQSVPFPEKAIDLMNESVIVATSHHKKIVTEKDVHAIISQQYKIPVTLGGEQERSMLLTLEDAMHEKIINQHEAVSTIANTMRRVRIGLAKRNKPLGSFLFLGPTGVGKTQTAKVLAETYYGSMSRMIRFDMSEFQSVSSIDHFLGSLQLKEPGQFVTAVRDQPFSLVLLDEIEKAYHTLLNLFLQVLDEGHLTDAFGRKVSVEQCIIIATSNAGAEAIREMVQKKLDPAEEKQKLLDLVLTQGVFPPELLNRFDAVVTFHPLAHAQLVEVALLQLLELQKRLKSQGYLFEPSHELAAAITHIGYDPQFGARPLARAIQNTVETAISKGILSGTIQKGNSFAIPAEYVLNETSRE